VPHHRILGVLNKVDVSARDRVEMALLKARFDDVVTISAHTGEGLDRLADKVVERRAKDWTELNVDVPLDQGRIPALVKEHGDVLEEAWDDVGWHARVSVPASIVWELKPYRRRRQDGR